MAADPQELLSPTIERYTLNGSETAVRFSGGRNVVLNVEGDEMNGLARRERDSSRVHTKNLSEYKWEVRSYEGRLLAVHGNYIAYRIFNDSTGEAVRVLERESRSRHLIRGFRKPTADLAWAIHSPLLAVLDVGRNLYIYSVAENCARVDKYLNMLWYSSSPSVGLAASPSSGNSARNSASPTPLASTSTAPQPQHSPGDYKASVLAGAAPTPRLSWCPYMPEDPENPEDTCHMLAIYQGTEVTIVNISVLKTEVNDGEVSLENARSIDSAILELKNEEEVTCVNLSPDATAVAVGLSSGVFSFYEMSESLRFVHHWTPEQAHQVQQIIFLDGPPQVAKNLYIVQNFRNTVIVSDQEQFWRSCLAVGEDGRRLALFECENWRCLAKLRFDTPLQLSRLAVDVDPSGRFIHVVDVDASNLFCVELVYSGELPRFAAVTQITFSHPIITLVPYERVEGSDLNGHGTVKWMKSKVLPAGVEASISESGADISLDDDAISGTGSLGTTPTTANFIVITHRSVQQLDVSLEKTDKKDDGRGEAVSIGGASTTGTGGAAAAHDELKIDTKSNADDEDEEKGEDEDDDRDHVEEKWSRNFSRIDPELFDLRMSELSEKVEQVSLELERLRTERAQYKSNADVIDLMRAFKEEFGLREDRLLANISDMIETSRADTVAVVRNALNENSIAVENSIAANHKIAEDELQKRIVTSCRETMQTTIVPAIERICALLYQKLNEQFRAGLQEFLSNVTAEVASLRASSSAVGSAKHSTPTAFGHHDIRAQCAQLIKANQFANAFQTAIVANDQQALVYLCHHVDPDRVFPAEGVSPLPQSLLVQLLAQLSQHLESDPEIRIKYLENVAPLIDPFDGDTTVHLPKIVDEVNNHLSDFTNLPTSAPFKRRLRMLQMSIRALIK